MPDVRQKADLCRLVIQGEQELWQDVAGVRHDARFGASVPGGIGNAAICCCGYRIRTVSFSSLNPRLLRVYERGTRRSVLTREVWHGLSVLLIYLIQSSAT